MGELPTPVCQLPSPGGGEPRPYGFGGGGVNSTEGKSRRARAASPLLAPPGGGKPRPYEAGGMPRLDGTVGRTWPHPIGAFPIGWVEASLYGRS